MKQQYASIPTKYKGIQFRSRLEARWACLFDLLRWEWEYEPVDLNGWMPDFVIKGNTDIYVEIKPFQIYPSFAQGYDNEIDEGWIKQYEKIKKANPSLPVLLLSNTPIDNESNCESDCFGFLLSKYSDEWSEVLSGNIDDMYLAVGSPPFLTSLIPELHAPNFCVKGKAHVSFETADKEFLLNRWKLAGNEVQYKKP